MRIAVTGAGGRLGRALVGALEDAPFTGLHGPIAWSRAEFDLDAPESFGALLDRERPELVIHAAAWTDVDGCAREPDLALARNGAATAALAAACAERGLDLVVISTNEVFDGARTDGAGYRPDDETRPANAYGRSKLHGEDAARAALAGSAGRVGIVRTSWLFGPGKPDFPAKIIEAARSAAERGEPLRAVGDEFGSPTYVADLADAVVELIEADAFADPPIHHAVNGGFTSRAGWARDVAQRAGIDIPVEEIRAGTWQRASVPPRWGVLEPTPLPSGVPLRAWRDAMADYAPTLVRKLGPRSGTRS
jgi:dTDP-4-dehydrorhamnose reductase